MIHQVPTYCLLIVVPIASAVFADGQDTGTLRMQFLYDAVPPEPEKIKVDKDIEFCGRCSLFDESLIVDKQTLGINNVVFAVYNGRGGSRLEAVQRDPKTVTLVVENCRFDPHVLCMLAGDTLHIVERDKVGHNPNVFFFRNDANFGVVPAGVPRSIKVTNTEPVPVPIECNIHPWMRAYLVVLDHPFVSVSDDQGRIEIEGLPAGKELVFRLFHESARKPLPELEIHGRKVPTDRHLIRLKIEPGMNDFGTIKIPAAAFGR